MQYIFLSLTAALLLAVASFSAQAQEVPVADAAWQGNDYVIRFKDSLNYTVDLGASDSMLQLHFSRPIAVAEGTAPGPNGITATLSRNAGDSMVVLTVRGDQRVGYSTLWRPYTHRLIVHTFNWDSLDYAAEQYHKGLLSLEQNLPDQARSYFSSALAFDKGQTARRAASVLGVMYEREGNDSLARIYLRAPFDGDDYMALANLSRRAGDLEGAQRNEELFHGKAEETGSYSDAPDAGLPKGSDKSETPGLADIFDDWRGIALVALAALLIILLAVWFSRRPTRPAQGVHSHTHTHTHREGGSSSGTVRTVSPAQPVPPAPPPPAPPSSPTPQSTVLVPEPSPEPGPVSEQASQQTPQTIPDSTPPAPAKSAEQVREESNSPSQPASPPADVTATAAQIPAAEKPVAVPESVAATTSEETTVERKETQVETLRAEREERRGSSQAEQLRRRMEAALSGATETQVHRQMPSTGGAAEGSTITEARRLNVSRDYVELRNRIAELRKRIEEE